MATYSSRRPRRPSAWRSPAAAWGCRCSSPWSLWAATAPCRESPPRASGWQRSPANLIRLMPYDPRRIESKWQRVWADEATWEVSNEPGSDPIEYVLEMLPYPSGEPHIGHLKVYSVGDAIAHYRRRTGHRVLNPMGYDAFGLPAENHAIKTGRPPRESTNESIAAFQREMREWGISIDWTREF